MVTHTFVHLNPETCVELADMASVIFDLQSASRMCTRFFNNRDAHMPDNDVWSVAIVIKYSRAFATGVRGWCRDEALASLSESEREFHEWIIAFRSKHVAHSVNAFEETNIRAQYAEERVEEEGFYAITWDHQTLTALAPGQIAQVHSIAEGLMAFLQVKINAESARLLEIVRQTPVRDVLSGAMRRAQLPNLDGVRQSRQRPKRRP